MVWKKSESSIRPDEVNTTSSKTSVLLRRNIKETVRMDEVSGEGIPWYEYEELVLGKDEYKEYLKGLDLINVQQLQADLDYIAIMTGVEL